MAYESINLGTNPNDGTGDSMRVAGEKINRMLQELYGSIAEDQFVMTENVTVENTATETSLLGDGNGSLTVDASKLVVGASIQLRSYGYIGTAGGTQMSTLRIKLGGVELIESVGTLPSSLENKFITMMAIISVVDSTHVTMNGYTLIQAESGISSVKMRSLTVVDPVEVDLSEDCLIEHTYQWTNADEFNTITLTNFDVQVK